MTYNLILTDNLVKEFTENFVSFLMQKVINKYFTIFYKNIF